MKGLACSSHEEFLFQDKIKGVQVSPVPLALSFLVGAWLAARDTEEGSSERFSVRVNAGPQRKGIGGKSNQLDSGLIVTSRGWDSAASRDVVEQPPGRVLRFCLCQLAQVQQVLIPPLSVWKLLVWPVSVAGVRRYWLQPRHCPFNNLIFQMQLLTCISPTLSGEDSGFGSQAVRLS